MRFRIGSAAAPCLLAVLSWSTCLQAQDLEPSKDSEETESESIAEPEPEPKAAETEKKHRLGWPGRELHWADYVWTGAVVAGSIIVDQATNPRQDPRWTGPILFDDAVEKALIGDTREGRLNAQSASGYLTLAPQVAAVVDGSVVPLLFDRFNWRVAWKMSLINVQAMSLNGLLSRSGHRGIGRERPDVRYCREDPEFTERCFKGSNSSFPSGHTSTAFVGAGLVCAHHLHMPLYGHVIADVGTCVVNLGLATSAGLLRVATGRHYISDVIAGAAVGITSGFVLPTFLYYRWKKPKDEIAHWLVLPNVTTQSVGLGVVGIY